MSLIVNELRLGEVPEDLLRETFKQLLSRCTLSPDWAGAGLSALVSWKQISPSTLDAQVVLDFEETLLKAGVSPSSILANIVSFVEHPFAPSLASFVSKLHTLVAWFFGKFFAELAVSDKAVDTMLMFLEQHALCCSSRCTSKICIESLAFAAKCCDTDAYKSRITEFLKMIREHEGFDPLLRETASVALC